MATCRTATPARRLLQREMPQIGQNQRQFLLVIRPLPGLPSILDQKDPDITRVFARQRSHPGTDLIVRNVDPAPVIRVGLPLPQEPSKKRHSDEIPKRAIADAFPDVRCEVFIPFDRWN